MFEKNLAHYAILLVPHHECEGAASIWATAAVWANFAAAAHLVRKSCKGVSAVYPARMCFCEGTLRSAADRFVRRVGRPRLEWVAQVQNDALRIAGSWRNLEEAITDEVRWKQMCLQV